MKHHRTAGLDQLGPKRVTLSVANVTKAGFVPGYRWGFRRNGKRKPPISDESRARVDAFRKRHGIGNVCVDEKHKLLRQFNLNRKAKISLPKISILDETS
jgi:hypothetical protein